MTEDTYLAIAGVIVSLLVQIAKAVYQKATGSALEGKGAMWTTYILTLVAAAIVKYAGGTLGLPAGDPVEVATTVVTQLGIVVGVATVIYRSLMARETRIV